MSRGRPPLEDIRKHFEKVTEVEEQILQINFLLWLSFPAGSFQFQLLQPLNVTGPISDLSIENFVHIK